jgi:hypothetical protein
MSRSPCSFKREMQHHIDEFRLGEQDIPDRVMSPEELYGRERAIEVLLAAFDRNIAGGKLRKHLHISCFAHKNIEREENGARFACCILKSVEARIVIEGREFTIEGSYPAQSRHRDREAAADASLLDPCHSLIEAEPFCVPDCLRVAAVQLQFVNPRMSWRWPAKNMNAGPRFRTIPARMTPSDTPA